MKLTNSTWDSLALEIAYDSTVDRYKGTQGIPWVYLSGYDKSGNTFSQLQWIMPLEITFSIVSRPSKVCVVQTLALASATADS
jgi:hypothetical protein